MLLVQTAGRRILVHRADIKQEHRVLAVAVLIHKRARRAPVVHRANTKQGYRVPVVQLAIHKVVLLVQTAGRRILARLVNIQLEMRVLEVVIPIHKLATIVKPVNTNP